ncbi:MAG: CDP-diacylglycerol--serine O-phosphatidyltransferase [Bacteroidales bacterium]|nr:CDP-diacylglycerol--serine O-phosphatidyltransferase [Bacteroidales bacterium]
MLIKKHIPNFITLLNLFSGSIAIVFAFKGNLMLSAWFIGFAAIFDFLDGMSARLLNAKSPIGLQLDSLADVISFGLAPSFIVYQLMLQSYNAPFLYFNDVNLMAFAAFLIPAFSALRLARFNIDENQTESFLGLPTPANALFFASLPLVNFQAEKEGLDTMLSFLKNYWVLLGLAVSLSLLMVSSVPLFSLKLKNFRFQENQNRFILIIAAVILFVSIKFYALPLIVILYILISIIGNKFSRA